jgi:hypothetical protein
VPPVREARLGLMSGVRHGILRASGGGPVIEACCTR